MTYHKPVLLNDCIELLQLRPGGTYVDVTFGGGGHSQAILEQLKDGKLLAFDQDPDSEDHIPQDARFTLIRSNFRYLKKMLRLHGVQEIDGLLGDFGVSSHQFDAAERGFSIRSDAPLDMRMNPEKDLSALQVVNDYGQEELERVLEQYGELTRPSNIAKAIIKHRPIKTTGALVSALAPLTPGKKSKQFLARVFQAIRIEVNEEIKVLEDLLKQSVEVIRPGGRLVCLSYHSLEDRPVKNFMKFGNPEGAVQKDFYGKLLRPFEPITRKPIVPSAQEIQLNPRARSAKLRAAERVTDGKEN